MSEVKCKIKNSIMHIILLIKIHQCLSPCPTVTSLPKICDELARVITRQISPQMSTSCVTSVLVKTVLRVPYDMSIIFMTKYK